MDTLEPPKYLASLIAAINDGAKSAQLGALALHARLQGPREAVQAAVDLHAGPLNAAINGSVNLLSSSSDLKVDADSGAITPLFGVVAAYVIMHDQLTPVFGVAALLVIVGLYLVNKPDPKIVPDPNVPA